MPTVIQLDPHVADLIAAGEVVERPASAVKELIENAIDAGAKRITIEIENGGMRYVRITDDGCGMLPDDARKAFLRHATSKLRQASDLAAIGTLGFRGEALAAISAVSHIDLLTRTEDRSEGVSLHLDAGAITDETPAGCPTGTTIVVRDLFYNTPARMKFMKSDAAESSAIASAVQQQALAHPEISFRFLKDGQPQLHTDGAGDRLAAIYAVFGRELAKQMVSVQSQWESTRVDGFVSAIGATRGNRAYETFFVNGRFVKSKMLTAALEQAYHNQIMTGRFPACVLDIQLPVQSVDVNVHPAKTEIKFLNEHAVFDAVYYAVLSALGKSSRRPEMQLGAKGEQAQAKPAPVPAQPAAVSPKAEPVRASMQAQEHFFRTMTAAQLRAEAKPAEKPAIRPATQPVRVYADEPAFAQAPIVASPVLIPQREVPAAQPVASPEATEPSGEATVEAAESAKTAAPAAEETQQTSLAIEESAFRVVGEAMDTYLIAEQGDTLYFIDKHAAHERILFDKLKAQHTDIMPQLLLTPALAPLSQQEATAATEHAALLRTLGFELEEFGGGTLRIVQIPSDLDIDEAGRTLQAICAKLLSGQRVDTGAMRDELLHTIACKAAIKGGWHTEPAEQERLVREVLSNDSLRCCPHGRPVCITLTKKQLEKQFKRT